MFFFDNMSRIYICTQSSIKLTSVLKIFPIYSKISEADLWGVGGWEHAPNKTDKCCIFIGFFASLNFQKQFKKIPFSENPGSFCPLIYT